MDLMASDRLRPRLRVVLLKHGRATIDNEGEPTEALLDDLEDLVERHVAEHAPKPAPKTTRTARADAEKGTN